MFRDFFTRKFLGEGETVEDFMEVTAEERERLQSIRDAWVRPPQVFIDQWNEACHARADLKADKIVGCYNEETGYFELNGLTDITYIEALLIMADWARCTFSHSRTTLPLYKSKESTFRFVNCNQLEVLWGHWHSNCRPNITNGQNDSRVRDFRYFCLTSLPGYLFQSWSSLEHVSDITITAKGTVDLHWSPLLSIESIQNIIAANPEGNSIKPHPTVYAKLTGDTTNEEVAAMDPEELQKWMELVPLAAEKNITFVA